jgi:molybdate transport system regulatory protein
MTRLTLRLDFPGARWLGPGKVKLLEAIAGTGSISAAGRSLGMSYRRAWLLVDDLNRCFRMPLVQTHLGGRAGGGAALTALGEAVVGHYRMIEKAAEQAAAGHIQALAEALAPEPAEPPRVGPPPLHR